MLKGFQKLIDGVVEEGVWKEGSSAARGVLRISSGKIGAFAKRRPIPAPAGGGHQIILLQGKRYLRKIGR